MTIEELEQIRKIIREETVSKQEYRNGQAEIWEEIPRDAQRDSSKQAGDMRKSMDKRGEVL